MAVFFRHPDICFLSTEMSQIEEKRPGSVRLCSVFRPFFHRCTEVSGMMCGEKKCFFKRPKNQSLEIEIHIYRKRPHICSLKLIFIQNSRFSTSLYPVFTSQKKGKSYHPAIKQETNATICQLLFSSEQTGHPRKPKRTVPENPYKPSGTSLSDISYQK